MAKNQPKRDNDYYLQRLRDEFPAVYADYLAGKFKNAASAFVAAGLRKPKSGLDLLRSAWKKASLSDRNAFKLEIGCVGPSAVNSSQTASTSGVKLAPASSALGVSLRPVHAGGHLTSETVDHIRAVMSQRSIKIGVSGVCIPLRFAVSDLEPSGDFSSEVSEGCRHGGWRGWICWAV